MKNIWLAIVSDIDDGGLFVGGVFDNQISANECALDYSYIAQRTLVHKLELLDVRSTYTPIEHEA